MKHKNQKAQGSHVASSCDISEMFARSASSLCLFSSLCLHFCVHKSSTASGWLTHVLCWRATLAAVERVVRYVVGV